MKPINTIALMGKTQAEPDFQYWKENYPLENAYKEEELREQYKIHFPVEKDLQNFINSMVKSNAYYWDEEYDQYHSVHARFRQSENGEAVIFQITLEDTYKWPYPFGFTHQTGIEEISAIGTKINSGKMFYRCIYENIQLHFWLTKDKKFESLVISEIDERMLEDVRFKATLKEQKANLINSFSPLKAAWLERSPVKAWRRRMADGDTIFTEEALQLSDTAIAVFLQNIEIAVAKKSPVQIVNAVKATVKEFNKLTKKNGHFIETSEREELATFIDDVFAATGIKTKEGYDITEEWREW